MLRKHLGNPHLTKNVVLLQVVSKDEHNHRPAFELTLYRALIKIETKKLRVILEKH